ncbi:MAG: hypothetical protein RLZZ227_1967 [Pseudomonadota bacterium]|jgi:probable O-glycosylation ligase (exosortase A-associated)
MKSPDIINSQSRIASNDAWWRHDTARLDTPADSAARPFAAGDTSGVWPFRLLMGFTVILLLAPQETFTFLKPFRFALVLGGLSALAYISGRMSRGLPVVKLLPGILTALLLVGWAVLTIPVSYWPGGTIEFLVNDYFKTVLVFLLLAHIIDDLAKLRKLAWGLVLMAHPLALTTLSNFMSGSFEENRVTGYNAGLTGNPNDMALMLNVILPFAIALFLGSSRGLKRLFLGATVCLLVAAIIVTFSRGGFLTLALVVLAYLWLLRKRAERIWIPLAFVIAVCALPFVPAEYFDRLGTITDIEADESGSAQTRWSDMGTAARLVAQHPLVGVGAGMNIFAMNDARGATWTEVHNVYLQLGLELGVPGLLLFFALFHKCMGNTKLAIRRSSEDPRMAPLLYLSEGIRVSLLGFAVAAMFYPVAYEFFFYYIAGLAIALCQVTDHEEARLGHKLSETR